MSKNLSVKVKTSTLTKALEEALSIRKKRWDTETKRKADHKKAEEAYHLSLLKLLRANKAKITDASEAYRYRRDDPTEKNITFSCQIVLPKTAVPEKPEDFCEYHEHQYKREREDIEQAIRILKMTDQEYVSASTYRSVAEYL